MNKNDFENGFWFYHKSDRKKLYSHYKNRNSVLLFGTETYYEVVEIGDIWFSIGGNVFGAEFTPIVVWFSDCTTI